MEQTKVKNNKKSFLFIKKSTNRICSKFIW